jgi:hypothetical protein
MANFYVEDLTLMASPKLRRYLRFSRDTSRTAKMRRQAAWGILVARGERG